MLVVASRELFPKMITASAFFSKETALVARQKSKNVSVECYNRSVGLNFNWKEIFK